MKIFKKKSISLVLAFAVMLSVMLTALSPAFMATSPFIDVKPDDWAFDFILEVYEDGVMTGTHHNTETGEREFSPTVPLTMAEWSVMMVRAWYADELPNYTKTTWFNREQEILTKHGIYDGITPLVMYTSVTRSQMAKMIANMMVEKGFATPTAAELAAAKEKITDIYSIPLLHRDAVALCIHYGILSGKGNGVFDGEGSLSRKEAAKVYVKVKESLAKQSQGGDTPVTPPAGSLVGTMSSTVLFQSMAKPFAAGYAETHAPITDYWATQPMDIRNIADRTAFNAACQTVKDSKMILTQGEFTKSGGINQYYHYAAFTIPETTPQTISNVGIATSQMNGMGGTYGAWGSASRGYGVYTISAYSDSVLNAMAPSLSHITDGMSERQKVEACVDAVVDRLTYQVDGGASWDNGGTVGDCTSYSIMLSQILSVAGIPNIRTAGNTNLGNHAWVQVRIDGQWYIVDAVVTESRPGTKVMTFAEHEAIYGEDRATNDWDPTRVARALFDAAYPG